MSYKRSAADGETVSAPPVIDIEALTKYYGDVRGVEDLSLSVERGEVFGFLGPNGAGKSTTIRLLLGLIRPTAGRASILGNDVTDRAALLDVKRSLGYIPDDGGFYKRITGEALLDYLGRLKGEERREALLDRFPIPEDRPVKDYSRGNVQKLAIVQAFMHDPEVLVMDEPTSGLDPLLQNEFYDLVREEQERGVTCFFSSHILSEVRRICDRVAIIRDGGLVALEDIDALLNKSGKLVEFALEEAPSTEALRFPGVAEIAADGDGRYTLVLAGGYDALIDRLGDYTVTDLSVREASLEDVFMHFYEEAGADGPPAPEEPVDA